MAWILKIYSIELRVISNMGHMNKLEDLVKLFLYNNVGDSLKSRKGPSIRKLVNGGKLYLLSFKRKNLSNVPLKLLL